MGEANTFERNDGAFDGNVFRVFTAHMTHGDHNGRARFAAQMIDRFVLVHAFGGLAVNLFNAVARQYALRIRGAVFQRRHHGQPVVLQANQDTQSAELAVGFRAHVAVRGGRQELTVRIQGFHHPVHRTGKEFFVAVPFAFHVLGIDEFADLLVGARFAGNALLVVVANGVFADEQRDDEQKRQQKN